MNDFDYSRVLTTGASGLLGSYVDFGIRTDYDNLDILDADEVSRFFREHKPTAIIHLAAATDTVRCERDPTYAFSLNALGTYNIAMAAREVGAVMVYVSTSRVFDGTKSAPYTEVDIPSPKTEYGRSKLLGEYITQLIIPDHIIVRTCWVFGGGLERDNKFYGAIMKQLDNPEISAINDVYGSPTYGKDVIAGIKQLLAGEKKGVFHVANAGSATRFDIVEEIVRIAKAKTAVRGVPRDHFESGHLLPTNEAVSSAMISLRPWQDALEEYLKTEWK